MNKTRNILAAIGLAIVLAGCATGRAYYNTLSSLQITTTAAYNGYLDLVVKGAITTNAVPTVSKDYNLFQVVWSSAVAVAHFNTNAVAPSAVTDAAAKVVNDISAAKGTK